MAQDWHNVGLWIDATFLIGFPIQMDSKARNGSNGPLKVDQTVTDMVVFVLPGNSPCQRKITIEPRVEQSSSVHLNPQLKITLTDHLRIGFHFQCWAIGMGADHADTVFGHIATACGKGDNGSIVASNKIFFVGLQYPAISLIQGNKACFG